MKLVIRSPRRARDGAGVDVSAFPEVPGCTGVAWGVDGLEVEFADMLLTADQALLVRDRCETLTTAEEQLRREARTYLTIRNPNAKQTADQVRLLTRLQLGDLDETD